MNLKHTTVTKVYFECFVRETNCCVCTNKKQHVQQQHRMSDIISTYMGHHIRKGRIVAEFLKIRHANG